MNSIKIFQVDAFTDTPLAGNPAAVVPEAAGLTGNQMLAIAREMNVSETAFVLESKKSDLKLRFFTPRHEVPFCGHAFISALVVLEQLGEIECEGAFCRVEVETGAGSFPADIFKEDEIVRVDMVQAAPLFRPCNLPLDELAAILGADIGDFRKDLPLELCYTGLWHLVVPFADNEDLDGLMPDFRQLSSLSNDLGVETVHVFAQRRGIFYCRDFAPALGIDEDPFTGSAAGALGAYLVKHKVAKPGEELSLAQGHACGRPGLARVVVEGNPGEPERVTVGGSCVVSLTGNLVVG